MIGRSAELNTLNGEYSRETGSICVLYGRQGSGKTTLLKKYAKGKNALWFYCLPGSADEQKRSFIRAVTSQTNKALMSFSKPEDGFANLIAAAVRQMNKSAVLIIDEFPFLVKASGEFMQGIVNAVHNRELPVKLQVILSTSSVYYVENSLVSSVGSAAMYFNSFIKLREFSFMETVRMFPDYKVEDIIKLYAVTGGVPGYLACFDPKVSLKENVVSRIIDGRGALHLAGHEFVKNELRETGVYNTILSALASGREKLNDIYEYTGYGRDKISVYLKNLIEREIVEKVFSYDGGGYANSKKGLYRIKDRFVSFWYRFIYREYSALQAMDEGRFYDVYIDRQLWEYASAAFVAVATEYLRLLEGAGKLPVFEDSPFSIEKCGSWYGKDGDVDIICEDRAGRCIVGQTNSTDRSMGMKEYEQLLDSAGQAGVAPSYVFLFSLGGFDKELKDFAADKGRITLIGAEDL